MLPTPAVETIAVADLDLGLARYRAAGYRLVSLYPADAPRAVMLERGDERVRIVAGEVPDVDGPLPQFEPQFLVSRKDSSPATGRAGMLYRDLIPGRLGGHFVASQITVSAGGPVDDWVHHHRVDLQLIIVQRGWVTLAYEDQPGIITASEGDLILQPPTIRHRVLEASPGLTVVELASPAVHETFADHELDLPNARREPRPLEQPFFHHHGATKAWQRWDMAEIQRTRLAQATGQRADATFIRAGGGRALNFSGHSGGLVFGFILAGGGRLCASETADLQADDAFVLPPDRDWNVHAGEDGIEMVLVTTAIPAQAGAFGDLRADPIVRPVIADSIRTLPPLRS